MAKKILIADDDNAISEALENKLNSSGYIAKVVRDGDAAIKALENGHYDLLLLDLMMPKVDGYGVLENMKKRNDQTIVVVLSNLGQEEEKNKVLALGAKDFIVKSSTKIGDVVERIESYL